MIRKKQINNDKNEDKVDIKIKLNQIIKINRDEIKKKKIENKIYSN